MRVGVVVGGVGAMGDVERTAEATRAAYKSLSLLMSWPWKLSSESEMGEA